MEGVISMEGVLHKISREFLYADSKGSECRIFRIEAIIQFHAYGAAVLDPSCNEGWQIVNLS